MDIIEKKYHRGYTAGVFDMFHVGHLNILENAKKQCEHLIVGVTSDNLCFSRKNKLPIINENDRMKIVEAIRYCDEVVLQEDMNKLEVVKKLNIDVVFVGSDWQGTEAWNQYEKEFNSVGCDVVYIKYTDGVSSSILRDKLKARN